MKHHQFPLTLPPELKAKYDKMYPVHHHGSHSHGDTAHSHTQSH